jgi:hypothetical protein
MFSTSEAGILGYGGTLFHRNPLGSEIVIYSLLGKNLLDTRKRDCPVGDYFFRRDEAAAKKMKNRVSLLM